MKKTVKKIHENLKFILHLQEQVYCNWELDFFP